MSSLILYRPLVTNKVTQQFGENKACVASNGRVVSKRGGKCPPGTRDFYKSIGMKGHNGLDYSAWHGEKIFHAGMYDGWMSVEKDSAGGIGVDVVSNEPQKLRDGTTSYIKTRYWHLKAPIGYDKKQVKLGEIIGLADNTGSSSGDHLHFGVKKCDKHGRSTEKLNGYNGAFDPAPYMNYHTHAQQAAQFLRIPPPPLSNQETQEIKSHLTLLNRLLLQLKEMVQNV